MAPKTPKTPRSSLAGRVTRRVSVRPGRRGTEPRAEVRLGACGPASPGGSATRSAADAGIVAWGAGSTVTASWMSRPSCWDSAWVISARSLVSSCSLTNSFGVAMRAVFSTSPSGRVSFSQAR